MQRFCTRLVLIEVLESINLKSIRKEAVLRLAIERSNILQTRKDDKWMLQELFNWLFAAMSIQRSPPFVQVQVFRYVLQFFNLPPVYDPKMAKTVFNFILEMLTIHV